MPKRIANEENAVLKIIILQPFEALVVLAKDGST